MAEKKTIINQYNNNYYTFRMDLHQMDLNFCFRFGFPFYFTVLVQIIISSSSSFLFKYMIMDRAKVGNGKVKSQNDRLCKSLHRLPSFYRFKYVSFIEETQCNNAYIHRQHYQINLYSWQFLIFTLYMYNFSHMLQKPYDMWPM